MSTRVPECYYCTAEAVTHCGECDVDLCTDCNANPDPLNESICEPCLEDIESMKIPEPPDEQG